MRRLSLQASPFETPHTLDLLRRRRTSVFCAGDVVLAQRGVRKIARLSAGRGTRKGSGPSERSGALEESRTCHGVERCGGFYYRREYPQNAAHTRPTPVRSRLCGANAFGRADVSSAISLKEIVKNKPKGSKVDQAMENGRVVQRR